MSFDLSLLLGGLPASILVVAFEQLDRFVVGAVRRLLRLRIATGGASTGRRHFVPQLLRLSLYMLSFHFFVRDYSLVNFSFSFSLASLVLFRGRRRIYALNEKADQLYRFCISVYLSGSTGLHSK